MTSPRRRRPLTQIPNTKRQFLPLICLLIVCSLSNEQWRTTKTLVLIVEAYTIHPNPLSNRRRHRNQLTIIGSTPLTATRSDGERSSSSSDGVDDSLSTSVEFPPPLSTFDTLKRAGTFWSSVLPVIGSYYTMSAEIQLREILTGESITAEEEEVRSTM